MTIEAQPDELASAADGHAPSDSLDVSVVMPCLDEEASVGVCVGKALAWMTNAGLSGEVIVVDNGSRDGSRLRAAGAGAIVIEEPQRGYGHALLSGFRAARGRVVVMGDADGTYDFAELGKLVAPLREGFDMVVGNRFGDGLEPGAMPILHRHIGTPVLSRVLRVVTGTPITDSQSGFRALNRTALADLGLKSGGMELASEMIMKAERRNLEVTEVPVRYSPRVGKSKLHTFRDGWRHLRFLLLNTPTYTFVLPGLVFVLLGLAALIAALVINGVTVESAGGQLGLVGTVFFVLGVMGLLFGVHAWGFSSRRGLVGPNHWIEGYRRFMTIERAFLLATALVVIGIVIDVVILTEITRDRRFVPARLAVALMAQSLIIIGAALVWSTLLGHMLDAHDEV